MALQDARPVEAVFLVSPADEGTLGYVAVSVAPAALVINSIITGAHSLDELVPKLLDALECHPELQVDAIALKFKLL